MVSNTSSVNYNNLGEVTTAIDAWLEDETGSAATLCIRTRVYGVADGVSGYGIAAQCGYDESEDAAPTSAGSGVLNYDDVVIDTTNKWSINKTHNGWTANCFAKSFGEVVDGVGAYPTENEVRCSLDIPTTTLYTVMYESNGGTFDGAPPFQIKWYDETLVLSDVTPTKTGHTFQGWGTSNNDTTVDYASGESYTSNAELVLYAIWEPDTWAVRYDPNGGKGAPEDQTKTYGQTLVLSETKPTRTGYDFKGWATASDGSVEYQPNDDYVQNADLTLYAIWEIKRYTVSYDANGGRGIPESQIKEYGQAVVIPESNPLKDNHIFLGWSTSVDGEVAFVAGDNYTDNRNLTLYAVWKRMGIMRVLNDNWIYDEACREQITGVITSGTGNEYTAIVKGVESLTPGVSFTMIPHVISTSTSPTLNVNGLGAKNIRQRISSNTAATVVGSSDNWLGANKPVKVIYDGVFWVVDITKPDAERLYGTVPVSSGGTGVTTDAAIGLKSYPIGSVYISVSPTPTPQELFGGGWVKIEGYFLRAGSSDDLSTSGSDTKTLTVDNLPSHSHTIGNHSHTVYSHQHSVNVSGGDHEHSPFAGESYYLPQIYSSGFRRFRVATSSTNNAWAPGTNADAETNIRFSSGVAASGTLSMSGTAWGNGDASTSANGSGNTSDTGSGTAFDVKPQYMTVHAWKRTT